MRQRLNPWAVILTAALTFGSLMAFVGPRSLGYHHWGYLGHADHHYRYNHRGCNAHKPNPSTEKPSTDSIR